MELRQLVYFEAVARYGSFTRAAEQLRIAQPAVSAQIQRLEAELGTTLLQRTTRRVALTHSGELFLVRVGRVLGELDSARAELAELAELMRGHLRIGVTQVLGSVDLPAALAQFGRRYPEVSLAMRTGLIAHLLDGVDTGDLDVVVGPIHDDLPERFEAVELCEETLVLVTAPGRYRTATLAAVRDEPFVCLPAASGLHTLLTNAAADAGFVPRIAFETFSPLSVRELVAAGIGVALLARSAAEAPGPVVDLHPQRPSLPHPPIGMIGLRGRSPSPAARTFQDVLRHHVHGAVGH